MTLLVLPPDPAGDRTAGPTADAAHRSAAYPTPEASERPAPWRPRSDVELLSAQLQALDRWHRRASLPSATSGASREPGLDDARRHAVAEQERIALHRWAEAALLEEYPFGRGAVPRAVVAHRNEWLRSKICEGLQEHSIQIAACTGDGAEASAAIVMEQPDLVFVEDLLPSLPGLAVIRRARTYAARAVLGAQACTQGGLPALLDAGARAAFSRRIPPADIAAELAAWLHGGHAALTMV